LKVAQSNCSQEVGERAPDVGFSDLFKSQMPMLMVSLSPVT